MKGVGIAVWKGGSNAETIIIAYECNFSTAVVDMYVFIEYFVEQNFLCKMAWSLCGEE